MEKGPRGAAERRDRAGGTLHQHGHYFSHKQQGFPLIEIPNNVDIFTAFLENEPFLWGRRNCCQEEKRSCRGRAVCRAGPSAQFLFHLWVQRETELWLVPVEQCRAVYTQPGTRADTAALWLLLLDAKHLGLEFQLSHKALPDHCCHLLLLPSCSSSQHLDVRAAQG